MRVLDLFAGTGSSTQAFRDRGHDVKTVENGQDGDFDGITYPMDVRQFAQQIDSHLSGWKPDFIWASPPCTAFSFGNGGAEGARNWESHDAPYPYYGPRLPISPKSRLGCELVETTLNIIAHLSPSYYVIENPWAGLVTMGFMQKLSKFEVTYCQYGDFRQKRTMLAGDLPPGFNNRKCKNGAPCHEAAPRGSKTGTQGLGSKSERAKIPYQLGLEMCLAVEAGLLG